MKNTETKRNNRFSLYVLKGSTKFRKRNAVCDTAAKTMAEAEIVQRIEELPVELILEIFSWATPRSLLNLSRTTKSWHSLLTSRSSIPLWKTARSNLDDFPDIPDDLNELQYANLAFGTTCSFCFKTYRNTRVVWVPRLRTCGRCLKSRFMLEEVLEKNPIRYSAHLNPLITFPSFSVKTRGRDQEFTTSYYPIDFCDSLQEEFEQTRNPNMWALVYWRMRWIRVRQAETFALWCERHPDAC
ncbi:hypothetical protein GALMADRAFT_224794 [Galerina marginata CBS 339.88]|uniref:F-box domain-containing protein n=1 Tax=Galerina marginata (strain CBS 339.88) TaxID=685588 RepID=A0A067T2L0_GALM3|nr:hypothetical protein GALMADRAFT_224794 [Galerina marginata CBS 339.88]